MQLDEGPTGHTPEVQAGEGQAGVWVWVWGGGGYDCAVVLCCAVHCCAMASLQAGEVPGPGGWLAVAVQ